MSAKLRLQGAWQTLGYALLLVISVMSLVPISQPVPFDSADKWTHWIVWALMMTWFGSAWPAMKMRCFLLLLAASSLLELLQGLLPWRFMEINDLLANLAGLLSGTILLQTRFKRALPWLDHVIANRLNAPPV